MKEEIVVGHCSKCNRKLTSLPYGEHWFSWHCFCAIVGAKPIFDHFELDQDTPIKATTAPRKFPSDYCEACGRVTGTEIYTGACGGCFIKRMLDQDNK